MPQEYVLGPQPDRRTSDSEPGKPNRVMVGWAKDRPQVQIGVHQPDAPFVFVADSDALKAGSVEGALNYESLWMDLPDRKACNDLIRLLRKARDDAFGKDA
jgi:hypothetical protein